jgi:hypothetical protein
MTMRERIADWISGGEFALAKRGARMWRSAAYECMVKAKFAEAQARDQSHRAYLMQERLNRIAACETPSSNGTVRRMARIAREAM